MQRLDLNDEDWAEFTTARDDTRRALRDAHATGREDGEKAYSEWGQKGYFWPTGDYEKPGFASKYVENLFCERAATGKKLLDTVWEQHTFLHTSDSIQVADFAGGPGCVSLGIAAAYAGRKNVTKEHISSTVLDPVEQWQPAVKTLATTAMPKLTFKKMESLTKMAKSEEAQASDVIVLSHVLLDFCKKEKDSEAFWKDLLDQIKSGAANGPCLILIIERFFSFKALKKMPLRYTRVKIGRSFCFAAVYAPTQNPTNALVSPGGDDYPEDDGPPTPNSSTTMEEITRGIEQM